VRVFLVAHSVIHPEGMLAAGWVKQIEQKAYAVEDADVLAEFAGRLCYQSWDRPNPATRSNREYLANIITQQHFSVMEHASFSFYVDGVSRALSHELVRHRHLSFSQLSQRYVDESQVTFVERPEVTRASAATGLPLAQLATDILAAYRKIYESLIERGLSRKEARQAARWVLPNATETRFIVTGNVRAWRDVIAKRNHPAADAEIRELARELLRQLKDVAPNSFRDMHAGDE
jgi:thymidylate synthase (FAD)